MSAIFQVWDEFNSDESEAIEITADSPKSAALTFAKQDIDGGLDGIYTGLAGRPLDSARDGQPISVRSADGNLYRFRVGIVEFEPVFKAAEVTED